MASPCSALACVLCKKFKWKDATDRVQKDVWLMDEVQSLIFSTTLRRGERVRILHFKRQYCAYEYELRFANLKKVNGIWNFFMTTKESVLVANGSGSSYSKLHSIYPLST